MGVGPFRSTWSIECGMTGPALIRPTTYRFFDIDGRSVRPPITIENDDDEARGYARSDGRITRVTAHRDNPPNMPEREVRLD